MKFPALKNGKRKISKIKEQDRKEQRQKQNSTMWRLGNSWDIINKNDLF